MVLIFLDWKMRFSDKRVVSIFDSVRILGDYFNFAERLPLWFFYASGNKSKKAWDFCISGKRKHPFQPEMPTLEFLAL